MIEIAKDLCIYCLNPAIEIRITKLYIVGVCKNHNTLSDQEINDIIKDNSAETYFD
jgi:hypothetical protein